MSTQDSLEEMIRLIPEISKMPTHAFDDDYLRIWQVYERRKECLNCKKQGDELENCVSFQVDYDEQKQSLAISCKRCEKQETHFASKYVEKMLGQSMLSKRFFDRTFETFKVDKQNQVAYKKCLAYAETFKNHLKGEGLILIGGYGTGKTHLAIAVLHRVLESGIVGVFSTVPELLAEIRKNFNEGATDNELIKLIKTTPFLIFDDMGTEKTTDWVQEQLFIIVNARYENMLPTVITSNCTIQELETKIGARTVSRIIEMCDGILLDGDDYRKNKLKK
jgi:DNA replication protein DnaC